MNNNQLMESLLQMNKAHEARRQLIMLSVCMGIIGLFTVVYLLNKLQQNSTYDSSHNDLYNNIWRNGYCNEKYGESYEQHKSNIKTEVYYGDSGFGNTINSNSQ